MPYGEKPGDADQEVVALGGESWESDRELVAHILRGSIEHCGMLHEAYSPWVYRFALKRLQDPAQAEDATREVFSILFNALPGFRGRPSLRVGISRITRDTVNRRLAARKCGEPWKDDADLVTKILQGSTEHFDMLYEAYFPRVYRFALKRLRDPAEAEDVTQEVFFTVFNSLPSFQGGYSLLVWVFGITRNTVNRRFRRARPTVESLGTDDARKIPAGEAPADRVEDARRVLLQCETVIESQLTPLQRRIFHLKHLRRQSIREIARALGKFEDRLRGPIGIDLSGEMPTEPIPGLKREFYRNMAVWVVILAIMLLVVTILRPEQMA